MVGKLKHHKLTSGCPHRIRPPAKTNDHHRSPLPEIVREQLRKLRSLKPSAKQKATKNAE